MRGLHRVDRWISRPRDPFAGLPKCVEGAGQKEVSCAGLRGRVLGAEVPQGGALVGAHMCCLVLANAWVIWAGRRHERRSSAGVFYHPGPMAGAAAGMPKVVQVLDVINSDVDELDLRFGITEDGDIVVVVRDFVQCARGVSKKSANQALAGKASENLARKALEADVKKLRAQLRAAHEVQRVPEEVSRFLATTAEVQLQQPEITGLAVPVAFTLHVPVQRDGECEYEHYGGVLQEEATKETSMLALEMLLKEVFFRDASENLARALGIAGGVFDTARWPDAVIAQADV